jgi:pyruvate/2-oxoacid:ferredoxin oxidoreductase alpha subunit
MLDPARCQSWGNVVDQATYCRHRREIGSAMAAVPAVLEAAASEWTERTGRAWGVLERYRCDGAKLAIVTMGSMAGTAREAVDAARTSGISAGLVKLRLFRPFPAAQLCAALAGVDDVVVLDRNFSPGAGGVLHQELRAALYGMPHAPRVHGFLAGVGGVNVPVAAIVDLARRAGRAEAAASEAAWM